MSGGVAPPEVVRLAELIEQVAGNVVPPGHYPFLDQVLVARMRETGQTTRSGYLAALVEGRLVGEWARLLPQITIKESYLFRTPQQFTATERLLPALLAPRLGERRLRVWSAGCAHGEEPVTLALLLAEQSALSGWDWRVTATDIDESALAEAARGIYGKRAMSKVPGPLVSRWFRARGDGYELAPELRSRIDYRRVNLMQEPYPLEEDGYAVIFLRNVLIYFRAEVQRQVVTSVARRLAGDGVLFIGPAESLWQLGTELSPVDLGDCFCYLRSDRAGRAERSDLARSPRAAPTGPRVAPPPPRPRAPSRDPTPAPGVLRPAPGPLPVSLAAAVRPAQTLDTIGRQLAENDLAGAETGLAAFLGNNPVSSDARALQGLLHDLRGEVDLSAVAYRAALFLDPSLFQIRLLLADCLRRSGSAAGAVRQLRETLAALAAGRVRELAVAALSLASPDVARRRCEDALRNELGGSGQRSVR